MEVVTSIFTTTTRKSEETENQQFFLDLSENLSHKTNGYPENWRDNSVQRITVYLEQKLLKAGTGRNA